MQEAFMALVWAVWDSLVGAVKNSVPTRLSLPTSWKSWAIIVVAPVAVLWVFDRLPARASLPDIPRPVLTSEVSDLATKQEVLVNLKQMVMAYEALQARVEALEAAAVKPKVKR